VWDEKKRRGFNSTAPCLQEFEVYRTAMRFASNARFAICLYLWRLALLSLLFIIG
jgi:hypothetical protein